MFLSKPREFRERGRLWQSSLMGKKTNLSFNELRAGAHLKSHGKIYQRFYIQLVSLIQIQLDGKSWTATAKRINWKDTQHPPHNNLQHCYFMLFCEICMSSWNLKRRCFPLKELFFFCVDICKKKVGRSEWWTPVFVMDSLNIRDHANSYSSMPSLHCLRCITNHCNAEAKTCCTLLKPGNRSLVIHSWPRVKRVIGILRGKVSVCLCT